MSGSEVSNTLKNRVEQTGVYITENSTIQLIPVSSSQKVQKSALVITNRKGNIITKDVLMMVTDEGDCNEKCSLGLQKEKDSVPFLHIGNLDFHFWMSAKE